MSDVPNNSDDPQESKQFLQLPLAGVSSPFTGLKPLAALLTLAEMRDFTAGVAKQQNKDVKKVWDFRKRETLSEATGFEASTISDHWRVLDQAGWTELGKRANNYKTTPRRLTKKA